MLNQIKLFKPIFDSIDGEILFLSPNPRHLYNSCCMDTDHCTGVDTDTYIHSLLSATVSLRGVCKRGILSLGRKNVWVPNVFGKMIPACNGIKEQAIGWKELAAADGVHLVETGYAKMAAVLKDCIGELLKRSQAPAPCSVSARAAKSTYYWRGFMSPVGSTRPKNSHAAYMQTHRGGSGGGGKMRGFPANMGQARDRSRPPYYRKY